MTLITIDRSVVEQALKALEKADRIAGYRNNWAEIFSLRAALEQPSVVGQEPVAWVEVRPNKFDASCRGVASVVDHKLPPGDYALYTHPQSLNCKSTQARLATLRGYVKEQPRQPLTEEQIKAAFITTGLLDADDEVLDYEVEFARAIERAVWENANG